MECVVLLESGGGRCWDNWSDTNREKYETAAEHVARRAAQQLCRSRAGQNVQPARTTGGAGRRPGVLGVRRSS